MTANTSSGRDGDLNKVPANKERKESGLGDSDRRSAMRKLAVGALALAGCCVVPARWTAPRVEFAVLPAHAATSAGTTGGPGKNDVPAAGSASARHGDFNLLFVMTYQSCGSCGIWFDSAELVIVHSQGKFSQSQRGSLLIKQIPSRQGTFRANIRSIPAAVTIRSATLYMMLNSAEGIANGDQQSVISVYENTGGKRGRLVRTIAAGGDIKGKGYSKARPNVPIDFTEYARAVHGR